MSSQTTSTITNEQFKGNDRILFGMIFGYWPFGFLLKPHSILHSVMAADLAVETNLMNIVVSITIKHNVYV